MSRLALQRRLLLQNNLRFSPLLGGARGGGGPTPYLGHYATRVGIPNGCFAGAQDAQCRKAIWGRPAVSNPTFGFPNWCLVGSISSAGGTFFTEVALPGTMQLFAALEYPSGTFTQITFGGQTSFTFTAGVAQTKICDPIAISLPANALHWIRTYYHTSTSVVMCETGASSENAPIEDTTNLGEVFSFTANNNTMGGAYGSPNPESLYGPCLALANITVPSVLAIGDSRMHGLGDTISDTNSDIGDFARSIGPTIPYVKHSSGGYQLSQFVGSHTNVVALAQYFSHVHLQLGINDIVNGSSSAATVLANMATARGFFPNNVVMQQTLETRATSTNGWVDLVNQTTDPNNAARVTVNTTLRGGGLPGLAIVFDTASALESSLNSGLWAVTGASQAFETDATHANQAGYLRIVSSGVINPALIHR
jgi:hypothetical protein